MSSSDSVKSESIDFRNFLEASPQAVVLFRTSDGCVVETNDLFCRLVGLSRAALLEAGACGTTGEHPGLACLRRVAPAGIELVTSDGRNRCFSARAKEIEYRGQGCCIAFCDSAAEVSLAEDPWAFNRGLQDMFEDIGNVFYATDGNGIITFISANIEALSGYSPSEVIGRNAVDFVYHEDQPERLVHFLKVMAGEALTSEYRMVNRSGDICWVRTSVRSRERYGQIAGVQGVLIDISDRKAIEEALRRTEEKYRMLVQNTKDAIFVIQNGRIAFVNTSGCALLDGTAEALKGLEFSAVVHRDDRPALAACLALLEKDQPCEQVALRLACPDGAIRQVQLAAAPIPWEESPAALLFLRDATLWTKMEEQLRIAQKVEAVGTLASGVVHNFNNLLMGINGNASLCLLHQEARHPARVYTQRILKLVESGSKLTAQLLDYARSGKNQARPMDLNLLVREICETLAATQKHITFRLNLAEDLPFVKADKSQIEQALLNLLLNAVDAMTAGGDIQVQTRMVMDGGAAGDNRSTDNLPSVLLTVVDSGIGMSPEILARIFEPFFTTKESGRGTGLGLSTVHGIIQNHGGVVKVKSLVGHGSRFDIYLPTVEKPAPVLGELLESFTISGRGTILVVDDEIDVLETSAELLEYSGFKVLKALNGAAALDIYRREAGRIDLVMIDIIMPEMNGKELFRRIRQINPQARVLFFSGYNLDQQLEQLLQQGYAAFLQKPYDHRLLCSKIMDIIS